jgi:hypothetical protein
MNRASLSQQGGFFSIATTPIIMNHSNRSVSLFRQHLLTIKNRGSTARRLQSGGNSSGSPAPAATTMEPAADSAAAAAAADRLAYLRKANDQMQKYYATRELMRQGKLKPHPANAKLLESSSQSDGTTAIQAGILIFFLVAFAATPFIGKKIASDSEFRAQYIPSWYDFTIPKPERPWTRQEIHEQIVAVERHLMERAQRGEFTDAKLDDLRSSMNNETSGDNTVEDKRQRAWDRLHPGLADDEDVNEAQ